jgi:hypothetical protein
LIVKYLCLLYNSEANEAAKPKTQLDSEMAEYYGLNDVAKNLGINILGGEALHPINTAKTLRLRDNKVMMSDGPFAETHEQLGGFYLIDCKDLDEAIAFAKAIPAARDGSIEIRPIWVFE